MRYSTFPAASLSMSSRSFTSCVSRRPLSTAMSSNSRDGPATSPITPDCNNPSAPTMLVSGVRSSWLTSPVKNRSRTRNCCSSAVRAEKALASTPISSVFCSSGSSCFGSLSITAVASVAIGVTKRRATYRPSSRDRISNPPNPAATIE